MRSIVSEGHNAIITTEKAINSKITIGEEGRRKNPRHHIKFFKICLCLFSMVFPTALLMSFSNGLGTADPGTGCRVQAGGIQPWREGSVSRSGAAAEKWHGSNELAGIRAVLKL